MTRLFAIVRSAIFASLFVALWTWFVPRWMGSSMTPRWNVASIILMIAGGAIMLRCVWDFAWTGRGTPAPFDPPRRLVITGLYRYVRNPMYIGMGLFIIGEAFLLTDVTRSLLILLVILWLAVSAFIVVYEEPTLARLFGDDYVEYRRNVRRWLPRLTPFDKSQPPAVPSPHLD